MIRGDVAVGEGGRVGVVLADKPSQIAINTVGDRVQAWLGIGLDGRPWFTLERGPIMGKDGTPCTASSFVGAIDELGEMLAGWLTGAAG